MSDHDHSHDHQNDTMLQDTITSAGHGHTHGIVDPSITSSGTRNFGRSSGRFSASRPQRCFSSLSVFISGKRRALADTIHNFGDAATAIPLAVGILVARKKPSPPLYLWLWTGRGSGRHIDCRYDSSKRDHRGDLRVSNGLLHTPKKFPICGR